VWLWIALAALLLVALAAGGIVALAATDDDKDASQGVSSQTVPVGPPTLDTVTGESTITIGPPTTTTTPTQPTTTTQPTTSTQPTTTTPGTIISWPAGTDGYTVVLKSTPTAQGRGPADAAAQQAINAGLRQVGVLNSSDYSSMNRLLRHFTGARDGELQAQAAPRTRAAAFRRRVPRRRRRA
jgi:hypothetical protein